MYYLLALFHQLVPSEINIAAEPPAKLGKFKGHATPFAVVGAKKHPPVLFLIIRTLPVFAPVGLGNASCPLIALFVITTK
jgi:hypothetical protein